MFCVCLGSLTMRKAQCGVGFHWFLYLRWFALVHTCLHMFAWLDLRQSRCASWHLQVYWGALLPRWFSRWVFRRPWGAHMWWLCWRSLLGFKQVWAMWSSAGRMGLLSDCGCGGSLWILLPAYQQLHGQGQRDDVNHHSFGHASGLVPEFGRAKHSCNSMARWFAGYPELCFSFYLQPRCSWLQLCSRGQRGEVCQHSLILLDRCSRFALRGVDHQFHPHPQTSWACLGEEQNHQYNWSVLAGCLGFLD